MDTIKSNKYCFVNSYSDESWISEINSTQFVFVASSFESKVLLNNLNISFIDLDEFSNNVDKTKIHDEARNIGLNEWDKFKEEFELKYKEFPLDLMHYSKVILTLMEVLQSKALIHKAFSHYKIKEIHFGEGNLELFNPEVDFLSLMNYSSGGAESLALKEYCLNNDIKFISYPKIKQSIKREVEQKKFNLKNSLNYRILKVKEKLKLSSGIKKFTYEKTLCESDVIIYTYAGYYFDQMNDFISYCVNQNFKTNIFILSGRLNDAQISTVLSDNIKVYLYEELKDNSPETIEKQELEFNERNLIECCFKRELLGFSETIKEIQLTEYIYNKCLPKLVYNHFSHHPINNAKTLVYRKHSVPTISRTHGILTRNNAIRDYYSTEYYECSGMEESKAIEQTMNVSNSYLQKKSDSNTLIKDKKVKYDLNLDKKKRTVIYCDNSCLSQNLSPNRHITYKHLKHILDLKKELDFNLILRFHHGTKIDVLESYVHNIDKSIIVQVSNKTRLIDVLDVADVVITHVSSVITEALLNKSKVIYLSADTFFDKSYFETKNLKIAANLDDLKAKIKELNNNNQSQIEDITLLKKLINLDNEKMIDYNTIIKSKSLSNFDSWINQIKFSANFQINEYS